MPPNTPAEPETIWYILPASQNCVVEDNLLSSVNDTIEPALKHNGASNLIWTSAEPPPNAAAAIVNISPAL